MPRFIPRIASRQSAGLLQAGVAAVLLWGMALVPAGSVSAEPLPPTPDTSIAAQRLLVRGMTEVSLGDYEEAIQYFETALKHVPQSPALLQALADTHSEQGNVTTALFYARQARKFGGDNVYYHRRLAELQQKADAPDDAIQTYRTLLERFPDDERAYRALAQLQADLDRPRAALETYNALQQQHSQVSTEISREMLALYRRVGDKRGIRTTLQSLIDLHPYNRQYRRALARHYREIGRPDAAIELLESLAREYPNDAELRAQLQQVYRESGRAEAAGSLDDAPAELDTTDMSPDQLVARAESLLDEVTASASADSSLLTSAERLLNRILKQSAAPEVLFLLADTYLEQGKYREAGQTYERALEKNPRSAAHWTNAASAHLTAGYPEQAASVAEEGLLLFPGEGRLAQTAAEAFLHLQKPKQSLKYFEKARALSDSVDSVQTARIMAGMGVAYTHLGHLDDADRALENARSLAPDAPTVLNRSAYNLTLREERLSHALELARRAVELAPENPACRHTLGWVQFQRGNMVAAEKHLQMALDMAPPSVPLLNHLGHLQAARGNDPLAQRYWKRALDRAPSHESIHEHVGEEPGT